MPTISDLLMKKLNTNPEFSNFVQTMVSGIKALDELLKDNQSHIINFLIALDKFPEICKDALETMANHEWYPDNTGMYIEDILKIGDDLKKDTYSCNIRMIRHFRNRIDDIERELIDSNASRQHIISEGCMNHHEERYNSSIPIFLSQADGIFSESSNASPFMLKGRDNASNDPRLDEISRHLFSINTLPIWIGGTKRPSSFVGLNRHQVLHGEATSYGTEENSLKAISFLNFVNSLCKNFRPPATAPSTIP